jgi:hypothetical protein
LAVQGVRARDKSVFEKNLADLFESFRVLQLLDRLTETTSNVVDLAALLVPRPGFGELFPLPPRSVSER